MEDARRVFDAQLGVAGWQTPTRAARQVAARPPRAPWWWIDDEDASQGFLASVGVTLDG